MQEHDSFLGVTHQEDGPLPEPLSMESGSGTVAGLPTNNKRFALR